MLNINNSTNLDTKNKNFSDNINNEKLLELNPNSNINYIKLLENKIEKLNKENENLQKIIKQNKNDNNINKILNEIEPLYLLLLKFNQPIKII